MSEHMTSRAEAAQMKAAIDACIDDLERQGFTRTQIGACMTGIALAVVAVQSGTAEARRLLSGVSDALSARAKRMTPNGAELVETVARAIERTSHDSDEDFAEAWAQWNVRHNRTVEARAALAAACAKAPHMTLAEVQREIGE